MLCRGAEPKQLAFSAALGVTLGIFPICGKEPLKPQHVFIVPDFSHSLTEQKKISKLTELSGLRQPRRL